MARITKADRDEATKFIIESLRKRKAEVETLNKESLDKAAERARKRVDRELKYTATLEHCTKLRNEITTLEAELNDKLKAQHGFPDTRYYSMSAMFADLVVNAVEEEQQKSAPGRLIAEYENRAAQVRREVFLATSHEDLVAVVRKLSVN